MKQRLTALYRMHCTWDLRRLACNLKVSSPGGIDSFRLYSQTDTKRKMVYNIIPQPRYTASNKERQEFDSIFPDIVRDICEPYKNIPEFKGHYQKVLYGNVPNHKQASGLTVVTAYKAFASPDDLTSENIFLANILGWCVDLFLCSWQMTDDLIDGSHIRRGLPCWYRNDGVGLKAVNDAILIERSPYTLLNKYFSEHAAYLNVFKCFHEVTLKVMIGQTLDTLCLIDGRPHFSAFTMERFELLSGLNGICPQALMPITLAMTLANMNDINLYKEIESILFQLGLYFDAQNDILDCYGDPLITGKTDSDIREGKCTWLIVKALQKATQKQREVLEKYYGRDDLDSHSEIKQLYEDLGILEEYLVFEEESYNSLSRRIQETPEDIPKDFLAKLVDTYYGRAI